MKPLFIPIQQKLDEIHAELLTIRQLERDGIIKTESPWNLL